MVSRSDVERTVLQTCHDDESQALVDKLLELMTPRTALLWLKGNDPHLGGAQPIVVLQLDGSRPVLEALQAFQQGAFA